MQMQPSHSFAVLQVGFGEDIDFLSGGRSGPLWSAFEGLGRHVAWFLGEPAAMQRHASSSGVV
jgi:hypothetical protein